ncbi:MAG TPA: family 10 glycosylhydrolase [Bacteroidia bacterium]|nr:family 10 glycosylhydrolase [Bacteroidia bacterium]
MILRTIQLGLIGFLALVGAADLRADYVPVKAKVPEPQREFRAAWIATVHNLDWPSAKGLSPQQQRAEMIALLDLAAASGLNAVVFQIRTECDAFYHSKLEPWSHFLSGKQGVGPSDGYDPLAFTIAEAHKRGIEVHAWFNPFRASATESSTKTAQHITRTHSSLMLPSGTMKWGNPASEFIRQRAIDVMVDVTRRYDVDGIHIDDYFYPYPKNTGGRKIEQFDDSASYKAYTAKGGKLPIRDWRRDNINSFVRNAYASVKGTKAYVDFGISPFGIWRPAVPPSIKAGVDAYDDLCADSRLWLNQGWLDYFSPQLYWRIDSEQNYATLYQWWMGENKKGRSVFPGIASSRILSSEDKGRPAAETVRQIEVTRKSPSPTGPGHIHWSIEALKKDRGGIRSKLRDLYGDAALPPASPWLGATAPGPVYVAPSVNATGLSLTFKPDPTVRWRVVQVQNGNRWTTLRMLPAAQETVQITGTPSAVSIRHVSPTGVLSVPTVLGKQ